MAKYAFKLLSGVHREHSRTYRPGEVILTDSDLTVHNSVVSTKFKVLSPEEKKAAEDAAVSGAAEDGFKNAVEGGTEPKFKPKYVPSSDELDKMSVQELKDHCESEEIPLGKAKTKEELIKLITTTSQPK